MPAARTSVLISATAAMFVMAAYTSAEAGYLCNRMGNFQRAMGSYNKSYNFAPPARVSKEYAKPSYDKPAKAAPQVAKVIPQKPHKVVQQTAKTARPRLRSRQPASPPRSADRRRCAEFCPDRDLERHLPGQGISRHRRGSVQGRLHEGMGDQFDRQRCASVEDPDALA